MDYFEPHKQHKHSYINYFFTKYYMWFEMLLNKYVLRKKIYAFSPWISMSWGNVEHNNWGDDINMFFLRNISKDYLYPSYAYSNPHFIHFRGACKYDRIATIGSMFHMLENYKTIVWGSGLLSEQFLPSIIPYKIAAVRGPLTRKVLIENGYNCPEVYGDPAMLLPYYYTPKNDKKKYKLGIIPHYVDQSKDEVLQFSNNASVIIINMCNYKKWTDVIDMINSCDFVASSSLHGMIVAEAYKVPNLWVEFSEPIVNEISRRFKFHDFLMSVNKDRSTPYLITMDTTLEKILLELRTYDKNYTWTPNELVASCPFSLKKIRYNSV